MSFLYTMVKQAQKSGQQPLGNGSGCCSHNPDQITTYLVLLFTHEMQMKMLREDAKRTKKRMGSKYAWIATNNYRWLNQPLHACGFAYCCNV